MGNYSKCFKDFVWSRNFLRFWVAFTFLQLLIFGFGCSGKSQYDPLDLVKWLDAGNLVQGDNIRKIGDAAPDARNILIYNSQSGVTYECYLFQSDDLLVAIYTKDNTVMCAQAYQFGKKSFAKVYFWDDLYFQEFRAVRDSTL